MHLNVTRSQSGEGRKGGWWKASALSPCWSQPVCEDIEQQENTNFKIYNIAAGAQETLRAMRPGDPNGAHHKCSVMSNCI